jgi:hypothetical protein
MEWLDGALKGPLPAYEVRALLAVALEDPLWDAGWSRALLEDPVMHALRRARGALGITGLAVPVAGQTGAGWIERPLFLRDAVGIPCTPHAFGRLDGWADLARS